MKATKLLAAIFVFFVCASLSRADGSTDTFTYTTGYGDLTFTFDLPQVIPSSDFVIITPQLIGLPPGAFPNEYSAQIPQIPGSANDGLGTAPFDLFLFSPHSFQLDAGNALIECGFANIACTRFWSAPYPADMVSYVNGVLSFNPGTYGPLTITQDVVAPEPSSLLLLSLALLPIAAIRRSRFTSTRSKS